MLIKNLSALKNNIIGGTGLRAQLLRGSIGVGLLKVLSVPLTLAASITLARALGPQDFGVYTLAMSIATILALPIGPGIAQMLVREAALFLQRQDSGKLSGLLLWANGWVVIGTAATFLLLAIACVVDSGWPLTHRWIPILMAAPILPLVGFTSIYASALRGMRLVTSSQAPVLVVRPLLHLLCILILLISGTLSAPTAIISQVIAFTGALIILMTLWHRNRPPLLPASLGVGQILTWSRSALPFTLLAAVSTLGSEIGILTLGWLGTEAEVGAMRVAQSGALLVAMPITIFNMVMAPHIATAPRAGGSLHLQSMYRRSARATLALSLPIGIPMFCFSEQVIRALYGESFVADASAPLMLLTAAQLSNVMFGSAGLFLTMSGHERDTLSAQVAALCVTTISSLLLVSPYGAIGAAVSVSIGLLTWNVLLAAKIWRRLKIRAFVH